MVTFEEAKKYDNAQYDEVIYDDWETFQKAVASFIQCVMNEGESGDDELNQWLYNIEKELYESNRLFNKAVEQFGKPLWREEAWHNQDCHKSCPFYDCCDKQLYEIDNQKYCVGQLYIDIPYKIERTSEFFTPVYNAGAVFMYFGKGRYLDSQKVIGEDIIELLRCEKNDL